IRKADALSSPYVAPSADATRRRVAARAAYNACQPIENGLPRSCEAALRCGDPCLRVRILPNRRRGRLVGGQVLSPLFPAPPSPDQPTRLRDSQSIKAICCFCDGRDRELVSLRIS